MSKTFSFKDKSKELVVNKEYENLKSCVVGN